MNSQRIPLSLPAGAQLQAVQYMDGEGVVLCQLPENRVTPWVTWRFYNGSPGVVYGRYFDSEAKARASYAERAAAAVDRWAQWA
jgi:putative hemolysin